MTNLNFIPRFDWQNDSKCWSDDTKTHVFFYPSVRATRKEGGRLDHVEAERARYCLGLDDGIICPAKKACLEHALANREEGVWGGMTEDERHQLRRSREARKRKSA